MRSVWLGCVSCLWIGLWMTGPLLAADDGAAVRRGLVVEEVGPGSALERAGLEAGDVLWSWRRLPQPPANPEAARGELNSVLDWTWVEFEQAPRGTVELSGRRGADERVFTVEAGHWDAELRPWMPEPQLRDYLKVLQALTADEPDAASEWTRLAAATDNEATGCWLLLRAGNVWARQQAWAKAQAQYRLALQRAEAPLERWLVLQLSGVWHEWAGDFESAHQAYGSARDVYEGTAEGDSLLHAASFNGLGTSAWRQGDLSAALSFFQQALEIRRRHAPDSLATAESLNGIGLVAWRVGDLERATTELERSLEIRQQLRPGTLLVAETLNNLGLVGWSRADLEGAEEHMQQALDLWQELAPATLTIADMLNNLAGVALRRGNLERTADLMQRALALQQELAPGSLNLVFTLKNLGSVAAQRGDLERAKDYFNRSLAIQQAQAPDSLNVAAGLNGLGQVAFEQGDLDAAADFFQRALEIAERLGPGSVQATTSLNNLGRVAERRGDLQVAQDFHQRALAIRQEQAPGGLSTAYSLHDLATVAWQLGELDRAEDLYLQALENRQRLAPHSFQVAVTLHALGRLYRRQSPPQLARADEYFRRAIDSLEQQVDRLGGSQDVRAGFRARYSEYYRDALATQLELGQPALAFQTLERSRARSFLEQLSERDTLFTADISETLDRQRRTLAERFDRQQRQLAKLNRRDHGDQIEAVLERLHLLRAEAGDLEEAIRRSSPRLGALQYPQPLDLAAARAALDPGTVMLSYSVGKERTDLFVVSREEELRVHPLAIGATALQQRVEALRELIENPPWRHRRASFMKASQALYETLIGPAAASIAASERLLLVPDGALHLLPFGALVRPTADDVPQYLAEWKPLHSVLSATVYAELKAQRRGAAPSSEGSLVRIAAF
ncbi:MAG: tetratricopeptide repeat protein, partial [Acidobacteriota bacterium]